MTLFQYISNNVFFTTRAFAAEMDVGVDSASRTLKKLAHDGGIACVTRGVWSNVHHQSFSPYGAVPYLLKNEHGYVSFLSALHLGGVISQIPRSIQVATTGRGRKLKTPIGEFEFFQLKPEAMRDGVRVHPGKLPWNIATPEKAWLDAVYLSTRKGRRFSRLPEIDLDVIDERAMRSLIRELPQSIQKLVLPRLPKT